jgi:hypothetical protein
MARNGGVSRKPLAERQAWVSSTATASAGAQSNDATKMGGSET